jgi:hypothetical protein
MSRYVVGSQLVCLAETLVVGACLMEMGTGLVSLRTRRLLGAGDLLLWRQDRIARLVLILALGGIRFVWSVWRVVCVVWREQSLSGWLVTLRLCC